MRWFVALVTACCLMAAGGARPDLRGGRGHDAQLVRVSPGSAAIAPRRDGGRGELRLAAYIVPVVAAGDEPPRVWTVASASTGASLCGRPAPVPVSRGPPRG